jgi:hypothetical protein
MKIKYLLILTVFFAGFFSALAQPNYRQAALDTTANYYQIVEDFETWIDTVQLPDSVKTQELKKFGRWASFWSQRLQCEDSLQNGLFSTYQNSLGMAWIAPYCTTVDDANWENFGPFPDALTDMGIISTIWFEKDNPDTILVGSGRTGGIFKSVNRGSTWYDVLSPSRIPAFGITSFAVSPARNPNTGKRVIYASTGSDKVGYSVGILKSEDGGESWAILDMFLPYYEAKFEISAKKIVVDHVNGNDILYAITGNRILYSYNGGSFWGEFTIQGRGNYIFNDIEVCPGNHDIVVISGFPSSGLGRAKVWITYNGGFTFTEILGNCGYNAINQVTRVLLSFPSATTLNVCTNGSSDRKILNFNPSNNQWSTLSPNYPLGWGQFSMFEVNPTFDHFYIGTEFFHVNTSTSVGSSKIPYGIYSNTHNDIRCMDFLGRYIMLGTDGGVIYSDDFGDTWVSINGYGNSGLTNNEVMGLDLLGGFEYEVVAGLFDNNFKHYRNNKWHSAIPTSNSYIQPGVPVITQLEYVGIGDVGNVSFNWQNSNDFLANTNYGRVKVSRIGNSYSAIFDWTQSNYFVGQWWSTPLTRSFADPDIVYTGGFNGKIYISSDGGNSFPGTGIQLPGTNADVLKIKLAPSNPQIVYALTAHTTWVANTTGNVLYRSDDGGLNWTDISGSANMATSLRNQWCTASDFTIDWNNPDRVWVCFGGLSMNFGLPYTKERVFTTLDASLGSGTEWHDITGAAASELPFLPATAIANQPGTSRVFLATDGGVFCKSDNDNKWTCYTNGLPIAFVNNMIINKETNELFASTYGYGVWKAALPCERAEQSFIIDQGTGDVTWSNTTFSAGNIVVKSGYKLTINENAQIFMDPNSSILVEKGAELVVDNATLTACEEMWQGIRVMGTYSLPQNTTNQGKVTLINGATIANARVGVETGKVRAAGGIIQAENAYFYNCEYGVKMHPYRNFMANNNSITLPNLSYFEKCKFATTDDLKILSLIPRSHIWLNGIQRIRIEGNVFENTHPTVPAGPGRGKGIEATNSVFYVNELCSTIPCSNGIPNTFRNLHYGIYTMATNSLTPMTVTNAIFENNSFGTYLNGITQAKVTGCVYTVPPGITTSGRAYGLYLDHCTQYTVEENHFHNGTALTGNTVGMIVNNSGSLNNELYNNTFDDLGYGILAQHNNTGSSTSGGLQVKCNDFSNVLNVDLGISMGESFPGNTGIARFQGSNTSVTAPAGNTFSWTGGATPFSDIHNNGFNIKKYYHHDIQGTTPATGENWVPVDYTYSTVLLENTLWGYDKLQTCPLHSTQTPLNSSQLYGELSTHETNFKSANLVLNIYRDGGIPELPEMVALAYPWETYYYFNTLMLESPYLSDQTLIAAINNTDLLPDLILKLVLIANPQCTRSGEVMGALEARDPQLLEYMMEEIMQGEDLPSPLEALEADVAYHNHLRYTTLNQIISLYLADSSTAVASDSLLQIFQRDPLIDLKYNEVFIHLQNENWEDAEGRLEALSQELVDCEYENKQYAEYTDFVPILIKMVRDSCEFWDLSSGEMDKLVELSDNGLYFPAAYARSIRLLYDSTYTYEEPIIFPVAQSARKGKAARPQVLSDAPVVQVYPNPARDYCIVEYQMSPQDCDATLLVTTPQGKVVKQFTLTQPAGQKIIDLKVLADGVYYITLKTKHNQLVTRKITVSN